MANWPAPEARRDDLAEAVAASEIALRQARDLYAQGLTGFLDVLDAERTLLDNRQDLAEARADVALLIADLYTALGAPGSRAVKRPCRAAVYGRGRHGAPSSGGGCGIQEASGLAGRNGVMAAACPVW